MNDKLERTWKKATVAYSKYYHGICQKELAKTKIHLIQNNQCPFLDSNQPPYRAQV